MKRFLGNRVIGFAGVFSMFIMLYGNVIPANAQNFYNAGYYGTVANEYSNYSTAQGVVAYLFQDPTALYDFYAYANAAQAMAGAAYTAAEAGYSANPTDVGYWALLSALYDWYYKYVVAATAYTAYMASDYEGVVDTMEDMFIADVINGSSIFYSGVASMGGTQ